ncbi:MAG: hypothetical protein JRI72_12515 [Deltaproteobacteria bacterium]|nr:hypothetical protein [Deltaproteobacteria bacterium]
MKSGIVKLDSLYGFVSQNRDVPHRTKDRRVYFPYKKLVLDSLSDVPTEPGWYAWFQRSSVLPPIYIGQSSKGKTSSLNARLKEELLEEYVAFWSSVDEDATEKLKAKYGGKYSQARALKKRGSDSIVWIACPGAKQGALDIVEHKLIWELKPTANKDRRDYSDIVYVDFDEVYDIMERAFTTSA